MQRSFLPSRPPLVSTTINRPSSILSLVEMPITNTHAALQVRSHSGYEKFIHPFGEEERAFDV